MGYVKNFFMILPIVGYGDPLLKKRSVDIDKNYSDLKILIRDMYETMYNASGVGLAAPQIGKGIRLFIIDTSVFDITEILEILENDVEAKEYIENAEKLLEGWKNWNLFEILFEGKGGHAALPHMGKDTITIGSQIITALQTIVSRNLNPVDAGVVSVTEFITDGKKFFSE